MRRPVNTRLDPSLFALMKARRRAWEPNAQGKLAVLRRLGQHQNSGLLPGLTESNAEQSWNEQLFGKVLGYQTLLSHDRLPFHLKPKSYNTSGKYDDFSLGFFGGPAKDVVLASAELKGAKANLDKPQTDKAYGGRTAVQQAASTAQEIANCRWAIVSNLVELRLYSLDDDTTAVATALLPEVRSARELAALCAMFDRRALLGDDGDNAEMKNALRLCNDHPSMPVGPKPGCYRVVFRFTPTQEQNFPLFEVEGALRKMTRPNGSRHWDRPSNFDSVDFHTASLEDRWVALDSEDGNKAQRIAMSTLGEVQVSRRRSLNGGEVRWISGPGRTFELGTEVVQRCHAPLTQHGAHEGIVTAELREVAAAQLQAKVDLLRTATNLGTSPRDLLTVGDFNWASAAMPSDAVCARCLCELAIQFRGDTGGVAFDPAKLARVFRGFPAA